MKIKLTVDFTSTIADETGYQKDEIYFNKFSDMWTLLDDEIMPSLPLDEREYLEGDFKDSGIRIDILTNDKALLYEGDFITLSEYLDNKADEAEVKNIDNFARNLSNELEMLFN